jgi:hypothetical protein
LGDYEPYAHERLSELIQVSPEMRQLEQHNIYGCLTAFGGGFLLFSAVWACALLSYYLTLYPLSFVLVGAELVGSCVGGILLFRKRPLLGAALLTSAALTLFLSVLYFYLAINHAL